MDHDRLTNLFRKLGARDPEALARSETERDVELGAMLFMRQAWANVISENDHTWIDQAIACAEKRPTEPYAGVGQALKKLRARGVPDQEIVDIVRGREAQMLFQICYLLSDPGDVEPELEDVLWALVRVDADGNVIGSIDCLHERVLQTDPTGREMRPRGEPDRA